MVKGRAWIRESVLISMGKSLEPYEMNGRYEEFI